MNDAEILSLVNRLERCQLSGAEFHHRDHLAVAVAYLYSSGFDAEAAMDKMRTSLRRFAAHVGSSRYHETLTRFWMLQLLKHIDCGSCLGGAAQQAIDALNDKDLPYEFYSRDLLASAEAKSGWVEPDLKEI